MATGQRFDGLHCRGEPVCDLGGGLWQGVRNAKGMQRQREGFEVVPVGTLELLPLLHFRLFGRHEGLGC